MARLIQDLLVYSRLSRSEIQLHSINLSTVILKATRALESQIERSQAEILVANSLGKILANETILIQVVSNLISNAIKFVPSNTVPRIEIASELKKDMVRLIIALGLRPHPLRVTCS